MLCQLAVLSLHFTLPMYLPTLQSLPLVNVKCDFLFLCFVCDHLPLTLHFGQFSRAFPLPPSGLCVFRSFPEGFGVARKSFAEPERGERLKGGGVGRTDTRIPRQCEYARHYYAMHSDAPDKLCMTQ